MQLESVHLASFEKHVAPHLQSDRGNFEMVNTSVKIHREVPNTLPGRSKGLEINSPEIRIWDGFKLACPTNFKLDEVKNTSKFIQRGSQFRMDGPPLRFTQYSYLSLECAACSSSWYTFGSGSYYISTLLCTDEEKLMKRDILTTELGSYSWPTINNPDCISCPTGMKDLYDISRFSDTDYTRIVKSH